MNELDFSTKIRTYLNILEYKYNYVLVKEIHDRDISFFIYQNVNSNRTIEVILTLPIVADIIVMKGLVNKETIYDGVNSFSLFNYCLELTNGVISKEKFEKPNREGNPVLNEILVNNTSRLNLENIKDLQELISGDFELFTADDGKKLNEYDIMKYNLFLKNLDIYIEILDKHLGEVLTGKKWIYPKRKRLLNKFKSIFE